MNSVSTPHRTFMPHRLVTSQRLIPCLEMLSSSDKQTRREEIFVLFCASFRYLPFCFVLFRNILMTHLCTHTFIHTVIHA